MRFIWLTLYVIVLLVRLALQAIMCIFIAIEVLAFWCRKTLAQVTQSEWALE